MAGQIRVSGAVWRNAALVLKLYVSYVCVSLLSNITLTQDIFCNIIF